VETVVAQDPGYGRPIGRVVRYGEPGRETALEDGLDRLAAARRRDQRERRAVARDPRVGHDHALRREHRAVDQALVAGLLQIVGEESLKAGERAGAADAKDRRMIHHHGRRTAHPLEAVAVEGQIHVTHGTREGRAATGR
jgi:hypothetical protein